MLNYASLLRTRYSKIYSIMHSSTKLNFNITSSSFGAKSNSDRSVNKADLGSTTFHFNNVRCEVVDLTLKLNIREQVVSKVACTLNMTSPNTF